VRIKCTRMHLLLISSIWFDFLSRK